MKLRLAVDSIATQVEALQTLRQVYHKYGELNVTIETGTTMDTGPEELTDRVDDCLLRANNEKMGLRLLVYCLETLEMVKEHLADEPRTSAQNSKLWPMLTDISKHVVWMGQKHNEITWRAHQYCFTNLIQWSWFHVFSFTTSR